MQSNAKTTASNEGISGFVHHLSQVKSGPSKKYFTFNLQMEGERSVRGVCFSTRKRKMIEEAVSKSNPIKIRRFNFDKTEKNTILMNSNAIIDTLNPNDVPFQKKEYNAGRMNISDLDSISLHQLISLKAKIINLTAPEIIKVRDSFLHMVKGKLVDPQGTVDIILWGDDIDKVEEGHTYKFVNLRVKKRNQYSEKVYVNPAKGKAEITECEPFSELLAIPEDIAKESDTCVLDGEIVGIAEAKIEFLCFKCNKPVRPEQISTCLNQLCQMKQHISICPSQCFVKVLVESPQGYQYMILGHDITIQALQLQHVEEEEAQSLSIESITDILLSLPPVTITYEKTSNIVTMIIKANSAI